MPDLEPCLHGSGIDASTHQQPANWLAVEKRPGSIRCGRYLTLNHVYGSVVELRGHGKIRSRVPAHESGGTRLERHRFPYCVPPSPARCGA